MKKLLFIALLILIVSLAIGCGLGSDSTFTIKVTGDDGIKFSGSYGALTSSGQTVSRSVDGITPAEYIIEGSIVSCSFQKQAEGGLLKVEITKGGKVINSSDTTAAYGVVSVSTP